MDDVRVHYNSDKPVQLQTLAYTHGTDIRVGAGLEKHLTHEAWHVVQQKQWRVQPTMQMQGVNVNDNEGLEKEMDVMGKPCIQLLRMGHIGLNYDFYNTERRSKYFSTENIKFCYDPAMDFNEQNFNFKGNISENIDIGNGKLKGKKLVVEETEETEDINFLLNPLVESIDNINDLVTNYEAGYSSLEYRRVAGKNEFEPVGERKNIKYAEVMFVKKGSSIYIAPNAGDNISLSHPSLLGGYPYEVDDAGILKMQYDKVTAFDDSGHYEKYEKYEKDNVNKLMTDELNGVE